jgi:hypothetical protein
MPEIDTSGTSFDDIIETAPWLSALVRSSSDDEICYGCWLCDIHESDREFVHD